MSTPAAPRLVRGVDFVARADGELYPATRPVVALCTCRASGRLPWCDTTHKVLNSQRPAD